MKQILERYYANDGRELHKVVNKILLGFGGLSQMDYDDFYSIANGVMADIVLNDRYDNSQSFDGFLYSCLENKIMTEMTRRNRFKRQADRNSISLNAALDEDGGVTLEDFIQSDFDIESVVLNAEDRYSDEMETYLKGLSKVQRKILELKSQDVPVSEIKMQLNLTDKQYNAHCNEMKSFSKASVLYKGEVVREEKMVTVTQTREKSKPDRISIASIIKKIQRHIIRFDHPLQRNSDQWTNEMKGNLISDILQGNPIPALVFAEQIINGIAIIWDLDGKQRCTNAFDFSKDTFKVSKNVRRFMIEYQTPQKDENGNTVFDANNFPIYENKTFDIRNKKFSQLPEELQDKFMDYNFEVVQYLNCDSEDIAYHICRYNDGRPMNKSQKGVIKLGETFANIVKGISNMPFFRDMGGYTVKELNNGTIDRVIVESVMTSNYISEWKKNQECMCEFLKDNANVEVFENFEDMIRRLESVVTDEVSDMFDSKNSFLWMGLFARFVKTGNNDERFIEFMAEFSRSLHTREINGETFETLKDKGTKDKNVVIETMDYMETLMNEFLGEDKVENVVDFIVETIGESVTQDDIALYSECLQDLTVNVDNNTRLLNEQNKPSLLAMVAHSFVSGLDLDNWIIDFFSREKDYVSDQRENFMYMKNDLHNYVACGGVA